MPMPLSISGLAAGYGRSTVLQDISMEVPDGQITSILGANGAGKTTLLRCISGLLPARAGSISFDGRRLDALHPSAVVASGIAHVPEGRQLFFDLTVEENLRLGAIAGGRPGHEERDQIERVFRSFPRLEERRRQPAGTLSGGEQQMVAIGRGLKETEGLTVLLVEQNARLALGLADQVFVIETGRIVASGTPETLGSEEIVKSFYLGRGETAA
jgi:branched-chain amino acid transport system ATP-binding protein